MFSHQKSHLAFLIIERYDIEVINNIKISDKYIVPLGGAADP